MPNYEELIKQSQANVKALSNKLKDFDKLHQDIKELIKQPEIFDKKFQEIMELAEIYTDTLGVSTEKYLNGNNTLFTEKLNELSKKLKEFEKEISRLVNTDFANLFKELQKAFINQTRNDLKVELKRFEEKSEKFQIQIEELKTQVERLESINLEKHFDKLQKTLAEIFGAINAINLTLTTVTQTLTSIIQTLGTIQTSIESYHKETKQLINNFDEKTSKHLNNQDEEAKSNTDLLESKIISLSKEIKMNKIIQIIGFTVIVIILIYVAFKCWQ